MILLICGTRTFADYELLCRKCDALTANYSTGTVVSGGARGADLLGEQWGRSRGWAVRQFPARWDTEGKQAGPLRNRRMAAHVVAVGAPFGVVAFWDGVSRGTKDMIDVATEVGIPVRVVKV